MGKGEAISEEGGDKQKNHELQRLHARRDVGQNLTVGEIDLLRMK